MSTRIAFADASEPPFHGITAEFIKALNEFAAAGYPFNDQYTLYKLSQQEAFQGYVEGLIAGQTHGYIELPTGVGKTALFIALIKNYLTAVEGREDAPRVLIAVPTEKLAVQTAQSFAKFMPDIAPTIETDGDEGQEIDWEKSGVGLQYGKVKHAHKKPKVLITTYQSLARDKANKIYDPAEYGFVIYDEGHVITAAQYGRAIENFHSSIQLAVSATPEYSLKKTVAQQLPHLYYRLPLAEAINRGDLCNVRPAILKTGYTIDIELFERLMEKQSGTPLSESQLEQLLNQEARNKAVVETYLRGIDPDTGERYLGQNAMVFTTATKHADAMVAQFSKALTEGDGIQIAEWLDQEGLELIAAVHGKADGQFLKPGLLPHRRPENRELSRGKEFYTEAEIFDLHERGKILILASVAKLKWGFDSPRDSLLFDLADRFSKVDATQIDGRAFRLDPNDPDKTATVFNLMDENTQELYDKYPKLIPIYCAEVIEGARFRPPAKRARAAVSYREPPPGLTKSLEESGFDVLTDIDAVRTISRTNREKRERSHITLPAKTEDWISAKDMAAEANIDYSSKAIPLYTYLQEAWRTAKDAECEIFSYNEYSVLTKDAGFFQTGGNKKIFCIHRDNLWQFKLPERTQEWLGLTHMSQEARIATQTLGPIYKALEIDWRRAKQAEEETFSAEGVIIPVAKAGIFRSGPARIFCLHKDCLTLFATPNKTPEWLGIKDMARESASSDQTIAIVFKELEPAWKEARRTNAVDFTANGITILTDKAGIFMSGTNKDFCLHKDNIPLFLIKEKTVEWLAAIEMQRISKMSFAPISQIYKEAQESWRSATEEQREKFKVNGKEVSVNLAAIRRSGGTRIFCLHRDVVPCIKTPEKEPGWLTMKEITRLAPIAHKDISPLFLQLQMAWEEAQEAGRNVLSSNGITLKTNLAGVFQSGARRIFCLHESVLPKIREFKKRSKEGGDREP